MMSDVGENEQPAPLDPEELAKFQEFQRFQEYLRFSQRPAVGQPPDEPLGMPARPSDDPGNQLVPAPLAGLPTMPATPNAEVTQQLAALQWQLAELAETQQRVERNLNPPLWRKLLRSRLIRWPIIAVLLAVLATWGVPVLIQHYLGHDDTNPGSTSKGTAAERHEYVPTAKEAVQNVYRRIGSNESNVCLSFNDQAQQQFAASVGVSGCVQAVATLHGQVTDASSYGSLNDPDLSSLDEPTSGQPFTSACFRTVSGGPKLGVFILTHDDQAHGWLITGYAPPSSCPSTSASATPTS